MVDDESNSADAGSCKPLKAYKLSWGSYTSDHPIICTRCMQVVELITTLKVK